ncbi:MAG: tRNA uridine-5-carboxymethylaminomethyl(34) synthesis GTPase MnmE [Candidatus Hydrothermales bacterium]
MHRLEDTICAPATLISKGSALNIVRISGEKTLSIFSKIAEPPPPYKPRKMYLGKLFDNETKKVIDKVQWVYYKKPRSYTGEDMIEIFTHGGTLIPRLVIKNLINLGARYAEPGEFTMRAVLNGKMDLISAQAINQIARAENLKALEISLKRLEGNLKEKFEELFEDLKEILAEIEVNLNYPEEDLPPFSKEKIIEKIERVENKVNDYLKNSENSRRIFDGIKISICGAPNVGKSTLFNRLLGKERSIVAEEPGTTRDYISEYFSVKGINSIIFDTAGLRVKTTSKVEKEGIKRAKKIIDESDIIIWVLDSQRKPDKREIEKIKRLNSKKRLIVVINKIDKGIKWDKEIIEDNFERVLEISALKEKGVDKLKKELEILAEDQFGSSEISLTLFEESKLKELLLELYEAKKLISNDMEELAGLYLKNCLNILNIIIGKDVDNEVLRKIFSEFCVGK